MSGTQIDSLMQNINNDLSQEENTMVDSIINDLNNESPVEQSQNK